MVNYAKGKIYKIVDVSRTMCYIGSTTKDYISKRFYEHKKSYQCYKEGKGGKTSVYDIFDAVGVENCLIELIEVCPCGSREELNRKEGEVIRASDCINKCVAGRTRQEHYSDNKEQLNMISKEYRDGHKEDVNEKQKEYYKRNREQLLIKHKAFRKANWDKINAKRRANYANKYPMMN